MSDLIEKIARGICKLDWRDDGTGMAHKAFEDHAEAALAAIKEAGYAVVPVDPTSQTISAAKTAIKDMKTWILKPSEEVAISHIYKAMTKAAEV